MRIFIYKDQQQLGPFAQEEVLAKEQRGEITGQDKVWVPGQSDWATLDSCREKWTAPKPTTPANLRWTWKRGLLIGGLILLALITVLASTSTTQSEAGVEVIKSRLAAQGFTLAGPEKKESLELWYAKRETVDVLLYFDKNELAMAAFSITAIREGQVLMTEPDVFNVYGRAIGAVLDGVVDPSDTRSAIDWHGKPALKSNDKVGSKSTRTQRFGGFMFTSTQVITEVDGKFGELPVTCAADELILVANLKKE